MLKKNVCVLLAAIVFMPAAWSEVNIGYVNVVGILGAAPQADEFRKTLESEFSDRDKAMVKLQKEIIGSEKLYQKDAPVLSEVQRSKRERTLLNLKRDLKRQQAEFNEDLSLRKNEELRKLQKLVAEMIDKVAKKGEYDLIVNEGVVFASKKIDVSKQVLDGLKKLAKEKSKPEVAAKK